MISYPEMIKLIVSANWQSTMFHAMLYFSVISVVVLEKDSIKKLSTAWYSLIMLAVIISPVSYWAIMKMFPGEQVAYYCRLYLTVPIDFIIAYALVLVANLFGKKSKMLLSIALVLVIVICGVWPDVGNLRLKKNAENIPQDVIQLSDMLSYDEEKKVFVPGSIVASVRQYDCSINLPYARNLNESYSYAATLLSFPEPDAAVVKDYCLQNDCGYFVAVRDESSVNAYLSAGAELIGYTDNYAVMTWGDR